MNKDLQAKWNAILKKSGLGVIQAGKASDKEEQLQKAHKRRGLPEWAHWGTLGRKYGKGARK